MLQLAPFQATVCSARAKSRDMHTIFALIHLPDFQLAAYRPAAVTHVGLKGTNVN